MALNMALWKWQWRKLIWLQSINTNLSENNKVTNIRVEFRKPEKNSLQTSFLQSSSALSVRVLRWCRFRRQTVESHKIHATRLLDFVEIWILLQLNDFDFDDWRFSHCYEHPIFTRRPSEKINYRALNYGSFLTGSFRQDLSLKFIKSSLSSPSPIGSLHFSIFIPRHGRQHTWTRRNWRKN